MVDHTQLLVMLSEAFPEKDGHFISMSVDSKTQEVILTIYLQDYLYEHINVIKLKNVTDLINEKDLTVDFMFDEVISGIVASAKKLSDADMEDGGLMEILQAVIDDRTKKTSYKIQEIR